jgi:hypothetical protein
MTKPRFKGVKKKLYYQHPYYNPYYTGRTEMNMPMMEMDKMEQMKQMMMEHMKTTRQIKQKVDMIDERLKRMESKMMTR